jgi:hypothetical protein
MFQAAFFVCAIFCTIANTKTIGHIFPVLGVYLPKCMMYIDKYRFYPVSHSLKKVEQLTSISMGAQHHGEGEISCS